MKLDEIDIYVPIVKNTYSMTKISPRKPNPFEWAALEIISKFSENEKIKNYKLCNFAESVLSIHDSGLLFAGVVESLRNLSLISVKNGKEYDEILLGDLGFTETGRSMHSKGYLPGHETEETVEIIYDPFLNKIIEDKIKKLAIQKEEEFEALNKFSTDFNLEKVKEYFFESGNLTPDDTIENIDKVKTEIYGKRSKLIMELLPSGNLGFEIINNPELTPFINKESVLSRYSVGNDEIIDEIHDFNHIEKISVDKEEINSLINTGKISFIKGSEFPINPTGNMNAKVCFFFNSEKSEISADEKTKTLKFYFTEDMPFKNIIYINDKKNNLSAGKIPTGEENTEFIKVYFRQKPEAITENITELAEHMISQIPDERADRFEKAMFKLNWKTPSEIWNEIKKAAIELYPGDIKKILETAKNYEKRIEKTARGFNMEFGEIVDIIKSKILDGTGTDIPSFEEKCRELKEYQQYIPQNELYGVIDSLINKIQFDGDYPDIDGIRNTVEKFKINKGKILLKENIYTKKVLIDLLTSKEWEILKEHTPLEKCLKSYKNNQKTISECFDVETGSFKGKKELLKEARKSYESLKEDLKELKSIFSELKFEEYEKYIPDISKLHTAFEKYASNLPSNYNIGYITDTNFFIHYPDFHQRIGKNECLIIPKIVLEELDNLKKNKEEARIAISVINGFTNLIIEESAPEIICRDFDAKKNDNLILSVAGKYIGDNVVLLTEDKALAIKARAENIKASGYEEFINSYYEKNNKKKKNKNKGGDRS